jgi:adenine-specific DNA-methyltransferase
LEDALAPARSSIIRRGDETEPYELMPSALDTLIGRIADAQLRADLRAAVGDLRKVTDFGLVFESHLPETVRLPHHAVRRGIKVVFRDAADQSMFEVLAVNKSKATIRRLRNTNGSPVSRQEGADAQTEAVAVRSLVALAEFGDPIYPGMSGLGSVQRGGNKAAHVVIKGENHHVLETLQFSHAGKVDCIYIDPPFNSGERDWKYNNVYVDADDDYRHSKWLAFMDRRLRLAKTLLNPDDSVLICAIDEKEFLRLGLLLDQLFPHSTVQMVSSVVKPEGTGRFNEFSRTNEFIFFVLIGAATIVPGLDNMFDRDGSAGGDAIEWRNLRRREKTSIRGSRPNQFYAVFVDIETSRIHSVGEALDDEVPRADVKPPKGTRAVFPLKPDLTEMIWSLVPSSLRELIGDGYVRSNGDTIQYLQPGTVNGILSGDITVTGKDEQGAVIAQYAIDTKRLMPKTVWVRDSHNTQASGTLLLKKLLPGRDFPSPKSLYAVEDALRFFVKEKPDAVVLDFFGGSGTTAHAVARLNHEDSGRRRSITVTNNEVSEKEAKALRSQGHQPGDPEWEALGIFDHITRPRITAAITGRSPDGAEISDRYRFRDEFPIADGFEENVDFFELNYLDAAQVEVDQAFAGIAPLLWLRAGGCGPIIGECVDARGRRKPYSWTEHYGVLFNTDRWRSFVTKLPDTATTVYIVTDSITEFSHIAGELPGHLDVVRLYERYLSTFAVTGR